jgi:hypothetical protein
METVEGLYEVFFGLGSPNDDSCPARSFDVPPYLRLREAPLDLLQPARQVESVSNAERA